MENLKLYFYFACALAGLLYRWINLGKAQWDRPSAWKWLQTNYGYVGASAGLTLACILFFMPDKMGADAYAMAIAYGVTGGEAIRSLPMFNVSKRSA